MSGAEIRFDDDLDARAFVREHPDGASFDEIAEARRIARRAMRRIQRWEAAPLSYEVGDAVREEPEAAQPVVAPADSDDALPEVFYSEAGLRVAALADAMDYRLTCLHRFLTYAEVSMRPRRIYTAWHGVQLVPDEGREGRYGDQRRRARDRAPRDE